MFLPLLPSISLPLPLLPPPPPPPSSRIPIPLIFSSATHISGLWADCKNVTACAHRATHTGASQPPIVDCRRGSLEPPQKQAAVFGEQPAARQLWGGGGSESKLVD